jgi:hypothetical protein
VCQVVLPFQDLKACKITDSEIAQITSSTTSSNTPSSQTLSSSSDSSTPTSRECDTEPCKDRDTSKSHTGAIAGGVIGGVAVIIIIFATAWIVLRRKHAARTESKLDYFQPTELPKTDAPAERNELPGQHGVSELGRGEKYQRSELHGHHVISELE